MKRIFQEVYLGRKFSRHYGLPRIFYHGSGKYLNERLLIPPAILKALHPGLRMGIASGRPRFEAELALKRFRLHRFFESVVTLDECEEEEARLFRLKGRRVKCTKPHPYTLMRAIREIGLRDPLCAYVGDVVDDMRTARAAGKKTPTIAVGFLTGPLKQKGIEESLVKAGADLLVKDPEDLLHLPGV